MGTTGLLTLAEIKSNQKLNEFLKEVGVINVEAHKKFMYNSEYFSFVFKPCHGSDFVQGTGQ